MQTHAAQVRDYVQDHLAEVLEDLRRLVHTETPSNRKDLLQVGLAEIEDYVTTRLGHPSQRRQHDGGAKGDVLDLTWPGSPGVEGSVLSLCHYDTVWPEGTVTDWPLTRHGDELTGPGVLDMKAGIVQTVWMLLAMRHLEIPHPALRLMLTGDEEIGSLASRAHIEAAARESLVTLIAEPSARGDVKVQRKGTVTADIVVHGVESHAGLDPEKGASAVHELARLVPTLLALGNPDLATTVNVGLVAGGSGRNVVAGRAFCEIEFRIQEPQEEDRVVEALEALTPVDDRCQLDIAIDRNRPPMNPTEQTESMLDLVRRAGEDLGEVVGTQAVGGASDGNYVAALGLPVIDGLGGIGAGPHARHEHITVSGLPRQTALMAGLVEQLATAR